MVATIDQIHEKYAIVELFNYQFIYVLNTDLPACVTEGDIIEFTKGQWYISLQKTTLVKKKVETLFDKLLKK